MLPGLVVLAKQFLGLNRIYYWYTELQLYFAGRFSGLSGNQTAQCSTVGKSAASQEDMTVAGEFWTAAGRSSVLEP